MSKDSRYFPKQPPQKVTKPQSPGPSMEKKQEPQKRAFGRVLQVKEVAGRVLPNPKDRLWNPSPSKRAKQKDQRLGVICGDENARDAWRGFEATQSKSPEVIPYNTKDKPPILPILPPPSSDLNNSFTEKISNLDIGLSPSPLPLLNKQQSNKHSWVEAADPNYPYITEILNYWHELEITHKVNPNYMGKQREVSYKMRTILVDWLVEVAEEYRINDATVHRCVHFVDRFLSKLQISRSNLQLLGTTCLFIACKVEEIHPPDTSDLVYITDNTYTKPQLLKMECLILSVLDFDLLTPTAYEFNRYFSNTLELNATAKEYSLYVIDLTLLYGEKFLEFTGSVVGISSCYVASKTCGDNFKVRSLKDYVSRVKRLNVNEEFLKLVENCVGRMLFCLLSSSKEATSVVAKHQQFQTDRFHLAAASCAACVNVAWF